MHIVIELREMFFNKAPVPWYTETLIGNRIPEFFENGEIGGTIGHTAPHGVCFPGSFEMNKFVAIASNLLNENRGDSLLI
ncbi:hypothetical protein A3726_20520 [Erythrobacter sp. HI0037]|nr:hypothetical protein A3726_20520 [Erythrobacter sp. HI0037]KZY19869.1 hypothetical protein A3727_26125 [Erythrobacter sp. HI0038]